MRQCSRSASEDLHKTGLNSVGDFLQRLPVSGGSVKHKFNSSGNFGFPPNGGGVGAGATTADLRNLGSNRVLVLVDGVRWVKSHRRAASLGDRSEYDSETSIIERIEVLTDGASAIYGSDAIAGVSQHHHKERLRLFEISGYAGGMTTVTARRRSSTFAWGTRRARPRAARHQLYGPERSQHGRPQGIGVSGFRIHAWRQLGHAAARLTLHRSVVPMTRRFRCTT